MTNTFFIELSHHGLQHVFFFCKENPNVFSNSPPERSGDFERSFDQLCPGLFQRMLAADLAEILPWLPSVAFSLTMRCRRRFKSGFVARFIYFLRVSPRAPFPFSISSSFVLSFALLPFFHTHTRKKIKRSNKIQRSFADGTV